MGLRRLPVLLTACAAAGLVLGGGAAFAGVTASAAPKLPPGVYFQDDGHIAGWDDPDPHPQKKGVVRDVTSPTFKGTSAIEAQQTYISSDRKNYHAEVVHAHAQSLNQDRYYGQAIYLKPDWTFHNQPVTFQQFSPENPGGPWLLFEVYNDRITYSTHGTGYRTVGSIAARWSSGIYPNFWDTNRPTRQRVLSIFHDQARIAATYDLAEPANW